MQKIIVSPIKGGAILFTIKVVANLLFVERENTGLGIRGGVASGDPLATYKVNLNSG